MRLHLHKVKRSSGSVARGGIGADITRLRPSSFLASTVACLTPLFFGEYHHNKNVRGTKIDFVCAARLTAPRRWIATQLQSAVGREGNRKPSTISWTPWALRCARRCFALRHGRAVQVVGRIEWSRRILHGFFIGNGHTAESVENWTKDRACVPDPFAMRSFFSHVEIPLRSHLLKQRCCVINGECGTQESMVERHFSFICLRVADDRVCFFLMFGGVSVCERFFSCSPSSECRQGGPAKAFASNVS